nr:hypothetical protein [Candidatus Sigynarchaeum springense]MDO8115983.1 hypothetical protein [Candidatus Sigynarchaeota archaeon]
MVKGQQAGGVPDELTLDKGYVKFTRKLAKMGGDYIFWFPWVYIKNGIVDPACEYEVYLRKKTA